MVLKVKENLNYYEFKYNQKFEVHQSRYQFSTKFFCHVDEAGQGFSGIELKLLKKRAIQMNHSSGEFFVEKAREKLIFYHLWSLKQFSIEIDLKRDLDKSNFRLQTLQSIQLYHNYIELCAGMKLTTAPINRKYITELHD